jgi:hypothetical protein
VSGHLFAQRLVGQAVRGDGGDLVAPHDEGEPTLSGRAKIDQRLLGRGARHVVVGGAARKSSHGSDLVDDLAELGPRGTDLVVRGIVVGHGIPSARSGAERRRV